MPKLRPYQEVGANFLAQRREALLADGMGLGKSAQAIVAIQAVRMQTRAYRVLIVAPAAIQTQWQREIDLFAKGASVIVVRGKQDDRQAFHELPADFTICSYEQLRVDIQKLRHIFYDVVVIDEAQRIKNSGSLTSLACCQIRRGKSWALTGTPIENSPSDLRSIFAFVSPGLLPAVVDGPPLVEAISPYVLRRDSKSILTELPDSIDQTRFIDLSAAQSQSYNRELEAFARKDGKNQGGILPAITRLKQICNYDPDTETSSKRDVLDLIVQQSPGQKILVFSQYVTTLRWLRKFYDSADLYIGGSRHDQESALHAFKTDPNKQILFLSLGAGGVGLNIQEASVVVLYDRWWNPAVESQAIARAVRMGQSRKVFIYRFISVDTIEERIENILDNKITIARSIFASLDKEQQKSQESIYKLALQIELINKQASPSGDMHR